MGIKDRRTKILLSIFLFKDDSSSYANFDNRIEKVIDLSFNQKTRGTISALLKEGLIEKNNESSQNESSNKYKLTGKGFLELCLQFPYCRYLKDKWDNKWRIISYEIPEKKRHLRDRLRREMAGWGLGPWHRSFWLTPHPIIENLQDLVSQKEEEEYIQAFESNHIFGQREILIEKVWGRTALDKKYRQLFKTWHDVLAKEGDKVDKLKQVVSEFVNVLKEDPGLPPDLIGQSWIGFEAFNIFKEIKNILLS